MTDTLIAEPVRQIVDEPPATARRGRVWKSPSLPRASEPGRRSRGAALLTAAVAGALVVGGAVIADLDDGPRAAPVDGSMSRVISQVGADRAWALGATGDGVGVAVIDTGVASVEALDGQVVAAVDLSAEQHDPSAIFGDSFGHGTHLSGIIAGKGDGFSGVAPDAHLASVKVAGRDGSVTRAQLVAGIDWTIEHADELDLRVLTLAFDAPASTSYVNDPLAAALERAWNAGIVVVTAAGNAGARSGGVAAPAYDPFVIAVAGVDGSGDMVGLAEWSNRGDGARNPDLAAPGSHIESLRAPGSDADVNHPDGYVDELRFRGTGSSQSAAVVAGTVALLLDARPTLTPDEVKHVLVESAVELGLPADRVGAGLVDIESALTMPVGDATQTFEPARSAAPVELSGVMTVDLDPSSSSWASSSWASSSWASSSWASSSWASSSWASSSWASSSWASSSWASSSWA